MNNTHEFLRDEDVHPTGEQLLLHADGELAPKDHGQVASHLELCWACRARYAKLEKTIAEFAEFDGAVLSAALPPPADGWPQFDQALARLVSDSGRPSLLARLRGAAGPFAVWRMAAAAAALSIAAGVWLTSPRTTVSAESILNQASLRERAWLYQPNTVLRWVTEMDVTGNLHGTPDGHYRILSWRNNYAGQTAGLIRHYDAAGALVWARWDRSDGSEVVFDRDTNDTVRIYPSVARVRERAAALDADAQKTLENYAAARERWLNPDAAFQMSLDAFNSVREKGRVEELRTLQDGKVFRLHFHGRAIDLEEDISAATFRRIRKGSVRHLANGVLAVEEARTVSYTTTSIQDFNDHDLRDVLAVAKHVVEVTPEQLLRH